MKDHRFDIVFIDGDRDGVLNSLVDGPLRKNLKLYTVLAAQKACFYNKIKVLKRLAGLDFPGELLNPRFQASLVIAEIPFLGGIQIILNLAENVKLSLVCGVFDPEWNP